MKDQTYTRIALLGLLMMALSLVVVACANDEDDGDGDGNGGGGTTQIDRMAVPGVNTALISSANKDDFNQGDPSTDVANFQTEISGNITAVRAYADQVLGGAGTQDSPGLTPAQVTGIVCPDIVSIDFSAAVQFPNGRQLPDDVIDPVLGLVLNRGNPLGGGGGIPDGIANDSTFTGTFPYLSAANP
jgi:hypothetical protein